jgi:uncharacterized repeat protein (TIGR03803 family)
VLFRFNNLQKGGYPIGPVYGSGSYLYGSAFAGGTFGGGVVFRISGNGKEKILYNFRGDTDGWGPNSLLISDSDGNMFGTTQDGGMNGGCFSRGCGTVFRLSPDGTETVLHAFTAQSDGLVPFYGLVMDRKGNLFGTTIYGGSGDCQSEFVAGCGTVFEIAADGKESVLYSFTGGADGATPYTGLVGDKTGNLYGTTSSGGATPCNDGAGCGTVFRLSPGGSLTTVYRFQGGSDGWNPSGGLVLDRSGNLYGATHWGGGNGCGGAGCGIVFKVSPDGIETVVHAFAGGADGANPSSGLTADNSRNLFGATAQGGNSSNCNFDSIGCGTIFTVGPDGTETVLYAFQGGRDGEAPYAIPTLKGGRIFGSTQFGGRESQYCGTDTFSGCGTLFEIRQ